MEEPEIEEAEENERVGQGDNPELVSIRTKLAEPNKLLPGFGLRSQIPVHLLPVQLDFESLSDHHMPLAHPDGPLPTSPSLKSRTIRPKNMPSRTNKSRSKSQLAQSPPK
jgi:hypothetical protein